jgi:chorismate mutase/prephenate dehydratase
MTQPERSRVVSRDNDRRPTGLDALREQIDAVDQVLLEALNQRAKLVLEVGRVKHGDGSAVYEPSRERRIVDGLTAANPGPFPDAGLAPVFREIISATRSLEDAVQVAYMGPEGTFSHQAALQHFGALGRLESVATIRDVFADVETGRSHLGIVPVENTTEGVVTQTLDCFAEFDVQICAESLLPVSLDLFSQSGQTGEVSRIASHPQPLAQSRRWREENLPGIPAIEAPSTAAAALLAVEDASVAAIGSSVAAEVNGLTTIASGIEDRRDNTTRFRVIGRDRPSRSGKDLTSVVCTIRKDQPGALHRLTSIHLRPIKGKPWEYLFFLDLEGHSDDPELAAALEATLSIALSTRVLGSFPRAEGDS